MLEQRMEEKQSPLETISDDFLPLIAKLVQESDKTANILSKSIQLELVPAQDEDEESGAEAAVPLALQAIEKAVKHVATRTNYGLESSTAGGKVPAAWNIWRWEVKEEFRQWLPKSAKDKAEARTAERRQAKADLKTIFQDMSDEDRSRILGVKVNNPDAVKKKQPVKREADKNKGSPAPQASAPDTNSPEKPTVEPEKASEPGTPSKNKAKRQVDPEKEAKLKELAEKKLARAEKEKKEKEAQEKSRSLFANFFGKAKPQGSPKAAPSQSSAPVAGPSRTVSEYQRTFKPFILKKDADLAPINYFRSGRRMTSVSQTHINGKEIIVIDDDEPIDVSQDVVMKDVGPSDVSSLSGRERLSQSISRLAQIGPVPPPRRLPHGLRTTHPHTVRTVINQLNEAEIAGDDQLVRSLLSLLRSRKDIPAKVLVFREDARPGYFGTWTRPSHEVGPRTPFAKDVVARDYTYDSGEEWEEEDGGDDVVEDAEDEDAGAEEQDSDLESWLVDDDDVEDPGTPIDERDGSPGLLDLPPLPPKRKSGEGEGAKSGKRRKVVVQLVPFTKGPCWESTVGQCEYEPFNPYKIHLFNDYPCPIDPFTFISTPIDEKPPVLTAKSSAEEPFAVPALPDRVVALQSGSTSTASPNATPKRQPAAPKTPFPPEHLPLLVSKITSMETGNITAIVEVVYQELRNQKVKKNAIEAKVREIGEKNKKVWVVKADVKVSSFDLCWIGYPLTIATLG
ncbi:hypothetical protein QCA50_002822 [Cerrena zonata]|uniref:Chromatin assembly factor 1 subunit A dimerization domain-containing protein n=1 Tax=Cerrena zonata TaxID=2478898 RepID=A0AAW0GIX3_9APHY